MCKCVNVYALCSMHEIVSFVWMLLVEMETFNLSNNFLASVRCDSLLQQSKNTRENCLQIVKKKKSRQFCQIMHLHNMKSYYQYQSVRKKIFWNSKNHIWAYKLW